MTATTTTDTAPRVAADWVLPALLGVVGTVVSATGSWLPSLWGDEGTSVLSAQRSWSSLLRMVHHVDAVHALFYAGLHVWVELFGASPFSVRFPSAVAAGAAVAAVTVLVRELAGTRLAVLAGIVCCTLPRITYAGEEARSYAMNAALAGWTLWVLVRLVSGRGQGHRWWTVYVVLLTLSIWLFLFSALLIGAHLVVVATARPSRRFLRRWCTAVAVTVLLVLPIAVTGAAESGQIAFLAHRTTVTPLALTVGLWFSGPTYAVAAWTLILTALVGGALAALRRTRTFPQTSLAMLATSWLLVPVITLLVANTVHPVFSGRYMTSSAPAAAILIALGVRQLGSLLRRPAVVMVAGAVILTAIAGPIWAAQRGTYAKNDSDWADISATIGNRARPGDAIVFDESARPSRDPRLALHTYPAGFRNVRDVTLKRPYAARDTWRDSAYTPSQAAARGRFNGVRQVWLVEYAIDGKADTYGVADMRHLGFRPGSVFHLHRSTITSFGRRGASVSQSTEPPGTASWRSGPILGSAG